MTNDSNEQDQPGNMQLCASCAGIQRNWRRAPGHAELVQISSRKVERSDGDSGGHTVTVTRYRCDACGTAWDYENDKTNQHAGWSVAVRQP
ncbi:hypothetical protein QTI66_33415 [Variovorax sp. J22R133]|uniref:hypothetical protein n=1 Tax=Variovorax brevis TaxID=3053503 RepID=UPI002575EF35|nr:hypothetical protein [Variovorax sp. J22R133]MDM0117025.1 hypothetical protein [Variovorax sp. J22R133]